MKYMKSKYNIGYDIDDKYVITNLVTNSSIKVDLNKKDQLNKLFDKEFDSNDRTLNFLLEKGFIVEDDNKIIENLRKEYDNIVNEKEVLTLNIMTTYDCNFRCIYCFQDRKSKSKI